MTDTSTNSIDRCPECGEIVLLNGQTIYNGPRLLPSVSVDDGCTCSRNIEN